MNITEMTLGELKPYEKNPRRNDEAVEYVANSIREFGFKVPIVVDSENVIIAGHTRYKAAKRLGLKKVPVVVADDLTDEQVRAYRLADNKVAERSEWDMDLLNDELDDIFELDMEQFDFVVENADLGVTGAYDDFEKGSLNERYIVPPFSVLHAAQGYWQERKKQWNKYIVSREGRDETLLGSGLIELAAKGGHPTENAGISVFDPVLTETVIKWFCPEHGRIIDPFTGGSVRGVVAAFTGHDYTGIDLRQEQIDANNRQYEEIMDMPDFYGEELRRPRWIVGDSMNIGSLVKDDGYDFMLTCPPYADLEVYSDDPHDLSNMGYDDFRSCYFTIIEEAAKKLKDNAYACIVVGEVRGKDGNYYNFVGDTIEAFKRAGMGYYNEIILETPIGTAALRANRTFGPSRKVVKIHQNVLVFVKGDPKKIDVSDYTYEFDEEE